MSVHRLLAIVLAVQVVLIAIVWWPGDSSSSRRGPAIDIDRDSIQRFEIGLRPQGEAPANPAILARGDDGWVVASAADYPATPAKVEEVLDALLALQTGPPIATQRAAHEALKVSDDGYGRRVEIVTADETVEWLVGAATSNSVNLRRVGEDDVYRATGSGEWSLRDSASSYYDPQYLKADPSTFDAVVVQNAHGELRFEQSDGVWTLAGLEEGEEADSEKIGGFLSAVSSVRMSQPVGDTVIPEHGLDGSVRIDWTVPTEDQTVSDGYAVGAAIDGEVYLKAEGQSFVVRVRANLAKRLTDAQRSEFLLQSG